LTRFSISRTLQLGLRNRRQHAQIIEPVGRDFMRREYFRAAEEISLEVQKASLLGSHDSSRVSTFSASMRQRRPGAVAFDHGGGVKGGGFTEVHLDDIGDIGQSFPRIIDPKVVQRYGVAGFFQPAASGDHQVIGRNGFQNLDHGLFRWQQSDVVLQQNVTSAVDEGSTAIAENVETEQHSGVQGASRSRVRIRATGKILDAITKQEFVAENFLVRGKNWLAGDKLGSGLGSGFAFTGIERSRGGSHSLSIGKSAREISPIRWTNSVSAKLSSKPRMDPKKRHSERSEQSLPSAE
jgi:hypothetical protein